MAASEREFEYLLKLQDGRRVYAIGTGWQEAARAAGVAVEAVKRAMPVRRIATEAERELAQYRIQKMLEKMEAKRKESEESK